MEPCPRAECGGAIVTAVCEVAVVGVEGGAGFPVPPSTSGWSSSRASLRRRRDRADDLERLWWLDVEQLACEAQNPDQEGSLKSWKMGGVGDDSKGDTITYLSPASDILTLARMDTRGLRKTWRIPLRRSRGSKLQRARQWAKKTHAREGNRGRRLSRSRVDKAASDGRLTRGGERARRPVVHWWGCDPLQQPTQASRPCRG